MDIRFISEEEVVLRDEENGDSILESVQVDESSLLESSSESLVEVVDGGLVTGHTLLAGSGHSFSVLTHDSGLDVELGHVHVGTVEVEVDAAR
eukprot:CAMPEP_0168612984 /NCGR_PEP_ID=MMETSP0449_2-20121227/3206_1 /TAXON_ID=1082188 /ORGANISM="Strombidium rassoulzadegani, Strain ras09" /LENGTH=92 /DNA_ID=CAMNT_0008653581 /DNA_START=63 /DNA_END=341 /DNA_ORIENTATION=+